MAKRDGTVYIETLIGTEGFEKGMNTIQKQVSGFSGAVKKLGAVVAATFVTGKIVQFGKEAIELGSDLQEVQNVVDVTFTTMSDKVDEFAQGAAEAAGLSETMAKRYIGTFGAMARAFDFAEAEAFEMSTSLTQLAGDVASFYNITQDEAYTKLKSVFTGETETLKDLGVVMTQNALDSYAMANGYGVTTKEMTEQQKVALRYRFVLDQLSAASGDFQRTSDGWANQMRILRLNIDSLKATVGQGLINIFTPVIKVLNTVISRLATAAKYFNAFTELFTGKQTAGGGGSPGEIAGELSDLQSGYEGVSDATEEAAKANKNYLSGLDEISKYESENTKGIDVNATIGIDGSSGLDEINSGIDSISERVKNAFNDWNLEPLLHSATRLKESLSPLVSLIKDGLKWGYDNVLKPLGKWTIEEAMPVALELVANLIELLTNVIKKLKPFANWLWKKFLSKLGKLISKEIADVIGTMNGFLDFLNGVFTGDWSRAMDGIVKWAENMTSGLEDAFWFGQNMILSPFVSFIKNTFSRNTNSAFQNLSRNVILTITSMVTNSDSKWRIMADTAYSWAQWIAENAKRPFQTLSNSLSGILYLMLTSNSSYWRDIGNNAYNWACWIRDNARKPFDSLSSALNNILRNILSNSSSNWSSIGNNAYNWAVWIYRNTQTPFLWLKEAIANIFGNLGTAIKEKINVIIFVINRMISGVVSGINSVISALNRISFTIPSWLRYVPSASPFAGKTFGFNIGYVNTPQIPYLATGTVIPPNAPFMAVLGDQKHGTNIEAPLDTIKQAVAEVLATKTQTGGSMRFTAQINRRTLFDEFMDEAQLRMMQTGRNPFEMA